MLSCVALIVAVVRGAPVIRICEPLTMPVPVTVSGVALPPAATDVGVKEEIRGTGFLTVKGTGSDVPPSGGGFMTSICSTAAVARSAVISVICKEVLLLKAVGR